MVPPRRMEPRLWLDAERVRRTMAEGEDGDLPTALQGDGRPDLVIESYRTDALKDLLHGPLAKGYRRETPHILMRDPRGGAKFDPNRPYLFSGIYR
ncbi:DUF7056 domain-containing protein [Litoreibacter roseus]|nr:hypothetical protein [Litoreibacter roseus]